MANTLNIKNLPHVSEIQPGDFLLVEIPAGSRIIDFKNFIISKDNITFAAELSGFDSNIKSLLSRTDTLTSALFYGNQDLRVNTLSAGAWLSAGYGIRINQVKLTNSNDILLLNSHLSATGAFFASGGNSDQWNGAFFYTNANSANWNKAWTEVNSYSASWLTSYNNVQANSADWEAVYGTVNATSATWGDTSTPWYDNGTEVYLGTSGGKSTDKVGINTTVPNEQLTVIGSISATEYIKTPASTSEQWDSTYSQVYAQSATWASGSTPGWVDDGTIVRLVTNTDNVGIGTTGADEKLTVAGGISAMNGLSGSNGYISGNVGIGVIEPSQKLHVDGNVLLTDGDYVATDKVRAIDSDGLHLQDDGGNGIFVKDGGNVGIGETNPGSKLTVAGDISAQGDIYANNNSYKFVSGVAWESGNVTDVKSNSANWDTGYTKAVANEADLSNVATTSGGWDSTKTTVDNGNSKWDSAFTSRGEIATVSGLWNDVQSKVAVNSGTWNNAAKYTSSVAFGTTTGILTFTRSDTTSFTVDIDGRYPALKTGAETNTYIPVFTTDGLDDSIIRQSSSKIGIGGLPEEKLSVYGHISATGDLFLSGGAVQTATSVATLFTSRSEIATTSAKWDSAHTSRSEIATTSGGWNTTKTTVDTGATKWDSAHTSRGEIALLSANWSNAWTKSQANEADISVVALASGDWENNFTTLNANSANWDSAHTSRGEIATVSGNWNSAHTSRGEVALLSADWTSAHTSRGEIALVSANWDSAWTKAQANEADLSNVATTSANWDSAYSSRSEIAAASGSWVDGTGTANYVAKWSDTDTVANSVLFEHGNNIGLGVTTTTSLLHLKNVDANNQNALLIDQDETSNSYVALKIDSETESADIYGAGVAITQDIAGGKGLIVSRDIAEAGSNPLVSIVDDNTTNNQTTLRVQHDGSGDIVNAFAGASEVFTLTNTGRVGINVAAPSTVLHLSGASDTVLTIASPDASERTIIFNDEGAMAAAINCDSSENLEFKAGGNATARLVIHNGGNVGIGNTSPQEVLSVGGTVSASKFYTAHTNSNNSDQWASAWSTVNSTSSKWGDNELDLSNVATTSANWDSAFTSRSEIAAASGKWDSAHTSRGEIALLSANWSNAWTKAQANEADISNVAVASGDWITAAGAIAFKTFDVNDSDSGFTWGSSDVVADSTTDTLKLIAGTDIVIESDATNDAIRIRSTSTGTTYTAGDGLDLAGTVFSVDLKANGGLVIESTELAVDLGASSITGTLGVADGGTGATTLTDGGVLLGNGTGAIQSTAVLANGELLIGDGSGDPSVSTLTGTANEVEVTNGAGSITLGLPNAVSITDLTTSSLVVDTNTLVANVAGYTDKVGIGTATPGELLHIAGATPVVKVEGTGSTDPWIKLYRGADLTASIVSTSTETTFKRENGDSTPSISLSEAGDVTLTSETKTYIKDNSSDDTILNISTTGATKDPVLEFTGSGFTNNARIYVDSDAGGEPLLIKRNDKLGISIDDSGQVGIGTSNPDCSLHVLGNAPKICLESNPAGDCTLEFHDTTSTVGHLQFDQSEGKVRLDGKSGKSISFGTNGNSDVVEITTSGNITLGAGKTVDGRDISADGTTLDNLVTSRSEIATTSGKWDSVWTTVNANSGGDGPWNDSGGGGGTVDTTGTITANDVAVFSDSDTLKGRSYTEFKSDISLNNVENTALSTWVGTSNITTLGTIGTGTWQGTAITDAYIASATTWNSKQAALTFGIQDTNAVKIDHNAVADNDYPRFTPNGLEGRSYAEVKQDLSLNNVENTKLSTWTGSNTIAVVGTISTGTWSGDTIALNKGGTGATTAAAARTNLGLVIGTDVQAAGNYPTGSGTNGRVAGWGASGIGDTNNVYYNATGLGIGSSPSYALDVDVASTTTTAIYTDGKIVAKGDIIAFSTSDERLKRNITPISDSLAKVDELKGVTFEWDSKAGDHLYGCDYGVLAQDVEKVLPLAVTTREDTGYKAVKYEKIVPLLIEAIKDLKQEVEELRARVNDK